MFRAHSNRAKTDTVFTDFQNRFSVKRICNIGLSLSRKPRKFTRAVKLFECFSNHSNITSSTVFPGSVSFHCLLMTLLMALVLNSTFSLIHKAI